MGIKFHSIQNKSVRDHQIGWQTKNIMLNRNLTEFIRYKLLDFEFMFEQSYAIIWLQFCGKKRLFGGR